MPIDEILNRREFLGKGTQIVAGSILLPEVLYAQNAKKSKPKEDFTKTRTTRRQQSDYAKIKRTFDRYSRLSDKSKERFWKRYKDSKRKNDPFTTYLQDLLVNQTGLAFDAEENTSGIIGEWFYFGDPEKREQGLQRVLKEEGGTRKDKEKRLERILSKWKIEPHHSGLPGQKKRKVYFLIDESLFNLATVDEVVSVLDRAHTKTNALEYDLHIDGKNLNLAENKSTRIFGPLAKYNVIAANAQSVQMANILNGLRTVTPGFRKTAEIKYLATYQWCQMNYDIKKAALKIALDKFGKKYPHLPIYEYSSNVYSTVINKMDARAEAAGYKHTPSEFRTSWLLERIPKKQTNK